MNRLKASVFLLGVCFLVAVGVQGQAQRSKNVRPVDASTRVGNPIEPDSPRAGSTLAAGPLAVVPRLMKFSGALRDGAGKPLSGAVDVTFALYSTEAGGSALWFETQSVQADELGRYTALLGAMHTEGLPVDLFTSGEVRWLGIQVGLEAEQQPRVLLVSVPYALKAGDAETLGGKPASAYMLSEGRDGTATRTVTSASTSNTSPTSASGKDSKTHNANSSALTACTAVTSNGAATANSIALFTTACNIQNSNLTQFNGNLGFGTTLPQARLHIFGPDASDADARYNFILGDSTSATAGVGGGILFSGYYSGTTSKAGFANIRGIKENSTQGNFASAMVFDTRANGGVQTERMRISSAGYVGIGTAAPAAKLHVINPASASIAIIADAPFDGKIFSGQKYGIEQLRIDGTGNVVTQGILDAVNFHADSTNTSVGYGVGSSGGSNTAIGSSVLNHTTSGSADTATGVQALEYNTTGNFNTAYGMQALLLNDAGSWNTAVGYCALQDVNAPSNGGGICNAPDVTTAGRGNTGIGLGTGNLITTGSFNTFLGYRADADLSESLVNATAIGANSIVGASNALVLGSISGRNGASSSVNVGIGTETPGDFLDVETAGTFNDNGITIEGSPSTYGDLGLKIHNKAAGGINWYLDSTSNGSGWSGGGYLAIGPGTGVFPTMFIHSGPHVGIGTGALDHPFTICVGCGVAYADGWAAFSSRRFKTNIHTLHNALGTVTRLRGVTYNDKSNSKPEVGVIAEEVEPILPQVVGHDKDGKADGVDYARLTAVLIEAVKEQQQEIKAQAARIRKQQAQIAQLASQVTGIQASLKAQPRTRRTVRVAKTHAAPPPATGSLPLTHRKSKRS